MAYGLRYYKELTHSDGRVVRLEIWDKDGCDSPVEIGQVCQAVRLDIQGDTEIDAPIIKTSLTMTFVDAPDHAEAATKKCGNWEEFYTSDATKWQVILKTKSAGESAFRPFWGGYITPDSYTEVLTYRGSVTIVARDNIGHLKDFPFDAQGNDEGMITLLELVRDAWDKVQSPMVLDDQSVANADWLLSEGVYAYDTYMNVSAFEGKNWYDALESALYAYGLTLRYTGNNNISFYSLRNLPRMGMHDSEDMVYLEPVFVSGAERELTPSVRRIEETVEYKLTEESSARMAKSIKFTGATSSIPYKSKNVFDEIEWKNIDVFPIVNTSGFGWGNGNDRPPLYFNPAAYPCEQSIKDDAQSSIYFATNTDQSGASWYAQMFKGKRFNFTMTFGRMVMRDISIASKPTVTPLFFPMIVKKVKVSIAASANGITKYLNDEGEWQTDGVILELSINEETRKASKTVYLESFSKSDSLVMIGIHDITLGKKEGEIDWWDVSKGGGIYVALQSLTFTDANGDALCETNRVNTNYYQNNNVILSREPKIAPALNDVLFPSIIKNGIFVKTGITYQPARTWYWGGQTPQQMAVYNHLQLLCYHAKPNNILRGTIVNADITHLQTLWMWGGAEHMLVSGSLNFINGYIENAVLREFARYEDMWGMLDEAEFPEVQGNSTTNVESGSASKNEGARNTINTEVYLGGGNIVLDDYMSDESENGVMNRVIKAYVDDLWHLDENGNLVTEHQVLIKNNAIINADLSFVGNGEGGGGGLDESQLQDYLDLHKYITEDALSSYYTKAESDAKYLALSGGILYNGYSDTPLYSKGDSAGAYIGFMKSTGEFIGYYGFTETTPMVWCGVTESYSLIHSGNIGSQSVAGIRIGEQIRTQDALDAFSDAQNLRFVGVGSVLPSPIADSDGIVISIPWYNTTFGAQIAIDDQSNVMLLRTKNQGLWNPWYQFITAKEDGYVYGLGGMIDIQYTDEINRYGGNIYIQHRGTVAGEGTGGNYTGNVIMCANGGNVLIGTNAISVFNFELEVNGSILAKKPIVGYMYGTNNNAAAFIFDKPGSNFTGIGSDGTSDTIRFGACDGNGTWVSYNQKWKFYGDVIVTGDFSFGSDIRFKDKIEDMGISIADIAKAPLFIYKWNDREDDTIYLGSSAQYWEKIAPWLVSGDDFKSLNYATLGVAMGISLAKKTINHEERIKVLEAEIKRLKREQYGN